MSCKSFIYTTYKSIFRYMCKYFLSFCWLSFHFLDGIYHLPWKALNFDVIQVVHFFFRCFYSIYWIPLLGLSWKYQPFALATPTKKHLIKSPVPSILLIQRSGHSRHSYLSSHPLLLEINPQYVLETRTPIFQVDPLFGALEGLHLARCSMRERGPLGASAKGELRGENQPDTSNVPPRTSVLGKMPKTPTRYANITSICWTDSTVAPELRRLPEAQFLEGVT